MSAKVEPAGDLRPHLAFILPSLGSGGAERAVANLASALAARGRRVTVLVLRGGGAYEAALHPDVVVVDLGLAKARRIVGRLAEEVRAREIDIVFSALFHLDLYALVSRAAFGWRARLVICFQNTPSVVARESASGAERLLMRVYRAMARRADQHFAITRGVAEDAAAFFRIDPSRIETIPNPIVDPALPPPVPVDLKALFATPPDKVAVASGRLTKQKDYPTLLAALARARRSHDLGLVVLGEGELRASLIEQAEALGLSDRIRFVGFQQRPLDWMAGADLFVLSSQWEGLANVLVEALWLGLPIVSTDCPHGPREVLADGAFGRLVPAGDAEALADAMTAALDAEPPLDPLRARALDFTIEAIAGRYDQALKLDHGG